MPAYHKTFQNRTFFLAWKAWQKFYADIFAGIVRHYYEYELDQKEPETDFQKWLVELFNKLHSLTENNHVPKSHFTEYGFQKIGKNFSSSPMKTVPKPVRKKLMIIPIF